MKIIDLSKTLEGHLVLWSKGWYGLGLTEKETYARLDEIIQEYTGLDSNHKPFIKDTLAMMMETAVLLGSSDQRILANEIATNCAKTSEKLTSYHLTLEDKVSMLDLFHIYTTAIAVSEINGQQQQVLLPPLLFGLKAKYNLSMEQA